MIKRKLSKKRRKEECFRMTCKEKGGLASFSKELDCE